jgi:peptidoglycan/LPS O-acetylase OafA/YrhL
MLYNVQVLRAVASLLVVHAHAAGLTGLKLDWFGGANGVDLFFVISGFIIAYVADQDSSQFLTRRLIRIVPIYWTSTLVLFALIVVFPSLFRSASSDPELLARSLAFLPSNSSHTEDGIPHPTLAGGWTLNYEMYFYVTFAVALAISNRFATRIAVAILAFVMAVVQLTPLRDSPAFYFYGHPIVVEFAYGIAAFHVVRFVESSGLIRAEQRGIRLVLIATVVAGFVSLAFTGEIYGRSPRWIASGIPAFVIVTCAVLLEKVYGAALKNRWLILAGDASYVLYLIHAYVVYGIIRLVLGNPEVSEPVGQLLTVAISLVALVAAIVIYVVYEKPILRRLKKRFLEPTGATPRT